MSHESDTNLPAAHHGDDTTWRVWVEGALRKLFSVFDRHMKAEENLQAESVSLQHQLLSMMTSINHNLIGMEGQVSGLRVDLDRAHSSITRLSSAINTIENGIFNSRCCDRSDCPIQKA